MSLALASRGYLCTRLNIVAPVQPPTISGKSVHSPEIEKALRKGDAPPAITAASTGSPSITGAETGQTSPSSSPSVGGATERPSIVGAKKD